ncbi:methylmalonyl-CoA mutase family protein [Chloroflexota bacterium]
MADDITKQNEDQVDDIQAAKAQWEKKTREPYLETAPETVKEFKTLSGNPVEPIYTPDDIKNVDFRKDIGFPGELPFTRGRTPNGYRSFDWPHDFYAGFGSSESANERYRDLVKHGANVITLALDLPTQIGLDSDDPKAKGEVGKVGVALSSLSDFERTLDGIDQLKTGIGNVANSIGPYALCLSLGLAERRGIDPAYFKHFRLQNDPLKEFSGRGTYILPVEAAIELSTDAVEYICNNFQDKWHWQWIPQYVCTGQMRSAGVSAAQEIGFGFAHFLTYIESSLKRGLRLEDFVPKMELHAESDIDLFEEAAKFRAARRLWAKLMQERYKATHPGVLGLRISTYASISRQIAQQPLNNMARITLQVLAAFLGGSEHIWAPAYDEALALPTSESTRIANQVKFIVHHEGGLKNTVDPLAGSYYVEKLTSQLEEEARHWLQEIEQKGGVAKAIENGFYHTEELKGLYKYQKDVESAERKILGINYMQIKEELPIDIFGVDPEDETRQVVRLQKLKETRDNRLVKQRLEMLGEAAEKKTAQSGVNLVPVMLDAVKADATVGEIYGVLRKVFGEFKPPLKIM